MKQQSHGIVPYILNRDLLDSVVRGLQGVEAEPLPEMVVVADLLNGVVLDVQPFQILRDEGVVEPLQAVRGDIEPLELALCRQQAVDIRYLEEGKKLSFNKKWRGTVPRTGGAYSSGYSGWREGANRGVARGRGTPKGREAERIRKCHVSWPRPPLVKREE